MTGTVERVVVQAGGNDYTGWKTVQVTASIKDPTRSFNITASEIDGEWVFKPFTPVKILSNGSVLLDGYVDKYMPSYSTNDHTVTIMGRGKGCDAVDCSVVHPGRIEDKTLLEIAQELDKFGIGFSTNTELKKIESIQVNQGETLVELLQNYARSRKITLMGLADGSIKLFKPDGSRHAGAIALGVNTQAASSEITGDKRFSEYLLKGQNTHGTTKKEISPKGNAFDLGVPRYRPKIVTAQEEADDAILLDRAQYEAKRAAGLSVKANATMQGFRAEGGELWEPGYLIATEDRFLKLDQDMLIERTVFTQGNTESATNSSTAISLVDPAAYDGESGGRKKSDDAWKVDIQ